MLLKRAFIVNLGGTAEVVISDFCPFVGQKSFLFVWYIDNVAWTHQHEGGENVEFVCNFIVSVGASVVAYYICKWLDGND